MNVAVALVDDAFLFDTKKSGETLVMPAYVAFQTGTSRVLACGEEAKAMMSRTPANISAARVLSEGFITDKELAVALFRFSLRKLLGQFTLVRPSVLMAIRSSDSVKFTAMSMAKEGGAREVFLMEMGMATAIGMELDVQQPELKAVLTMSDDWFEFAVISLAGVVAGTNGPIGTRDLAEDIRNHLMLTRQFSPDLNTLTTQLESNGVNPRTAADVAGWEMWAGRSETGRRQTQALSADDLALGMMPTLVRLTERIKNAIRTLSNDQQFQLGRTTILAAGSAMRIPGLAQMIAGQLGHSVTPFESEAHPALAGCRSILKELGGIRKMPRLKW
jgi:rod shape-determining protein MreB